mgnify:CR=1 FL=1
MRTWIAATLNEALEVIRRWELQGWTCTTRVLNSGAIEVTGVQ